jgi:hypothetical protein
VPFQHWIKANRAQWKYRGQERPPFAIAPQPRQDSVWDYPRPPRLAPDSREVVVRQGPVEIARLSRTIRVLETVSSPTFYIPPDDVTMNATERAAGGRSMNGASSPFQANALLTVRTFRTWRSVPVTTIAATSSHPVLGDCRGNGEGQQTAGSQLSVLTGQQLKESRHKTSDHNFNDHLRQGGSRPSTATRRHRLRASVLNTTSPAPCSDSSCIL